MTMVTETLPGIRRVEHVMGMPIVLDIRDDGIDEAVVELAFTVSTKPVVISGSMGDSGSAASAAAGATGFRYLLMPRRLLS